MIGAVLKQAEDLLETMQVAHAGPRHVGRLVAHDGGMLEVTGFNRPMGSGARVIAADGTVARAEVVGFRGGRALLVPLDLDAPHENGARVEPDSAANMVLVGDSLMGRGDDAMGMKMDGRGRIMANAYRSEEHTSE